MELRLGRHSFDVRNRPLVAAVFAASAVGDLAAVEAASAQRPVLIEVAASDDATLPDCAAAIVEIATAFDGPVSIRSHDAAAIEAGLRAGACVAHDPEGLGDRRYREVVEAFGASLIIGTAPGVADVAGFLDGRASSAQAAGIEADRIMVHVPSSTAPAIVNGRHWAVSVGDGPTGWGRAVRAVMAGARLVFTESAPEDIRSIRRATDTIAELLARRTVQSTDRSTQATREAPTQ